jgi:hypothetical protein
MKPAFLDNEEIFDECKRALPDFLCPKSKRKQLPLPYWKQLWEVAPTSLGCLEKLFAQTIEQAMWAMASDPRFENLKDSAATSEVVAEQMDDSWIEDDASKSTKASSKTRKKKQKKSKQALACIQNENESTMEAGDLSATSDMACSNHESESTVDTGDLSSTSDTTCSNHESESTVDTGDLSSTSDSDGSQLPDAGEVKEDQADEQGLEKSTDATWFLGSSNPTLQCAADWEEKPTPANITLSHSDDSCNVVKAPSAIAALCIEPPQHTIPSAENHNRSLCSIASTGLCKVVDEPVAFSTAREEELPKSIEPPPGLERLEERACDSVLGEGPMKVVPTFATPMLPQELHGFGGLACSSHALGHSELIVPDVDTFMQGFKSGLQGFKPVSAFVDQQTFNFPWPAHPVLPQVFLDVIDHAALGA